MIFMARQLMEKTIKHDETLFVLFIDLKKAYNSIPRQDLWQVLKKCGVPPTMLSSIQSFHQDMKAEIRVGTKLSDPLEGKNGLRQGCTLATTYLLYSTSNLMLWLHVAKGVCRGWN